MYNMNTSVSISQQYLLASKARAKLMKCAATENNKDYDLRVLVGHANLLDRVMESVDVYTSRITQEARAKNRNNRSRPHTRNQSESHVDYVSSDEDEDNDCYSSSFSSSDSSYDDDESSSCDSDEGSGCEDDELVVAERSKYASFRTQVPPVSLVTVTIDQCLDEKENDGYSSETDSDLDESPVTPNMEQDLSMILLTPQSKGVSQHCLHNPLDNREFGDVTAIQV